MSVEGSWLDNARNKSVRQIAVELGAVVRRDRVTCPDPSCGDNRASIFASKGREVWRCHRCGAWGDAIAFVAHSLTGRKLDATNSSEVREWFGEPREFHPVARLRPKKRPPKDEVRRLVSECGNVSGHVDDWVKSRIGDIDITGLGLAGQINMERRLPAWAEFRRLKWNESGHRLIVPAFDSDGFLRSCRARQIAPGRSKTAPKALPPRGFAFSGLVMANPEGVRLLKGSSKAKRIVIVEGEPGFLACGASLKEVAVFGIVAGSWSVEIAAKCAGLDVLVVTDLDEPGDKYFEKIEQTIACKRAPFDSPDEILLAKGMDYFQGIVKKAFTK